MDYNQRSRGQKSGAGHTARAPRRSMGSRIGLEKRGAPAQQPPRRGSAPRPNQTRSPSQNPPQRKGQPRPGQTQPNARRPQQQINPQKNGYTPGSPRRQRRVTQAEILRRTRRRRLLGVLTVLAVLAIGAFVSVNLLFKVAIFRVENFDRTTPANTGIYTEDEIIAALDIEKNSNLFGFSTAEKTQQLQAQFPYLDKQVIPETYNSLLANAASSAASDSTDATPESAQPAVTDIVTQLWQLLQDDGLLDGLTALDISDTSQLSFTYQGRVDVLLGNSSSLDYKLRMAAKILTDPDKGLSGSDRGTLDVSDQLEDGEIRGYFQPYEQPTPTPEPAPEPDPESENAENAEEPPTE